MLKQADTNTSTTMADTELFNNIKQQRYYFYIYFVKFLELQGKTSSPKLIKTKHVSIYKKSFKNGDKI